MAILIIGETEKAQIARVVAYAKAHPIPFETLRDAVVGMAGDTTTVMLKDRRANTTNRGALNVMLPGGYRAAFSVEAQPAGFVHHLSISVEGRAKPGMMANLAAVEMIAKAFGMRWPPDNGWIEEFEPGEFAINLLVLYEPTPEGHA